jgi:hypothetical protein
MLDLKTAVEKFAQSWAQIDDPELFCKFACEEIDDLARLLCILGEVKLAAALVADHSTCDNEGDEDLHAGMYYDDGEYAQDAIDYVLAL